MVRRIPFVLKESVILNSSPGDRMSLIASRFGFSVRTGFNSIVSLSLKSPGRAAAIPKNMTDAITLWPRPLVMFEMERILNGALRRREATDDTEKGASPAFLCRTPYSLILSKGRR